MGAPLVWLKDDTCWMQLNVGLLSYGKNHNHDYLTQLLIDILNIMHLLNFKKTEKTYLIYDVHYDVVFI